MTPGSKLDVAGDVNLSGSVLYQGSPILQMPGGLAGANIALGLGTLQNNTNGVDNVATGYLALQHNTSGYQNVASGLAALGLTPPVA